MQHQIVLDSIQSMRELKARIAAAETLYGAKAFRPIRPFIGVYAQGTFTQCRTGEPVFCDAGYVPVSKIGYSNFCVPGDSEDSTYKVKIDPNEFHQFKLVICS